MALRAVQWTQIWWGQRVPYPCILATLTQGSRKWCPNRCQINVKNRRVVPLSCQQHSVPLCFKQDTIEFPVSISFQSNFNPLKTVTKSPPKKTLSPWRIGSTAFANFVLLQERIDRRRRFSATIIKALLTLRFDFCGNHLMRHLVSAIFNSGRPGNSFETISLDSGYIINFVEPWNFTNLRKYHLEIKTRKFGT